MTSPAFLNDELSKRTSIFRLRLWVVIGICVGAAIVLVLSLYFTSKRCGGRGSIKPNWRRKKLSAESVVDAKGSGSPRPQMAKPTIPSVSKEIQEIRVEDPGQESMALALVPQQQQQQQEEDGSQKIHIEIGKKNMILCPERAGPGSGEDGSSRPVEANKLSLALVVGQPEVSQLGWGHWFTLRELEEATDGFTPDNVIGEGGYGIVYKGILEDITSVAVKNLLNNRSGLGREGV